MRRIFAAFMLLLAASAQAQPQLGRLFNTQQERQAIDARRAGATPAQAPGPQGAPPPAGMGALPMPPGPVPYTPPGSMPAQAQAPNDPSHFPMPMAGSLPPAMLQSMAEQQAAAMAAAPAAPPGMPAPVPTPMPAPMPPAAMANAPGMPGMPAGAGAPMPYPAGGAGPEAAPAEPDKLTLNGVVRTSSGRSTVWLNNVPQSGRQNRFSNRNRTALTVTLPSGKKVVLQPGQRYDLADGRVKDINEP